MLAKASCKLFMPPPPLASPCCRCWPLPMNGPERWLFGPRLRPLRPKKRLIPTQLLLAPLSLVNPALNPALMGVCTT